MYSRGCEMSTVNEVSYQDTNLFFGPLAWQIIVTFPAIVETHSSPFNHKLCLFGGMEIYQISHIVQGQEKSLHYRSWMGDDWRNVNLVRFRRNTRWPSSPWEAILSCLEGWTPSRQDKFIPFSHIRSGVSLQATSYLLTQAEGRNSIWSSVAPASLVLINWLSTTAIPSSSTTSTTTTTTTAASLIWENNLDYLSQHIYKQSTHKHTFVFYQHNVLCSFLGLDFSQVTSRRIDWFSSFECKGA